MNEGRYSNALKNARSPRKIGCGLVLALLALAIFVWTSNGWDSRAATLKRFDAALVDDIIPDQPLKLRGHILVIGMRDTAELDESLPLREDGKRRWRRKCDALCAALLALPDVESVTFAMDERRFHATRFRLVSKEECRFPTVIPDEPDAIRPTRSTMANNPELSLQENKQRRIAAARALDTAWHVRLSTRDCIMADFEHSEPDFVIEASYQSDGTRGDPERWGWTKAQLPIYVSLFEISDAEGEVLLRRQFVRANPLSIPMRPGIVASCGKMCLHFGWARGVVRNTEEGETFHPATFLLDHTNLEQGLEHGNIDTMLRDALQAALADPAFKEDEPIFDLVGSWMMSLRHGQIDEIDREVLSALVRDPRINDFAGFEKAVEALGYDAGFLADPILDRISADYDQQQLTRVLSRQYLAISDVQRREDRFQRFAHKNDPDWESPLLSGPTDRQLAILRDPVKRRYAYGLIIQQGDYGAASVPLLLSIIEQHVERTRIAISANPQAEREIEPIDSALVALCRIGPDARSAVPALRALHSSWLADRFEQERQWHLTLARVGFPLDELENRRPPRFGPGEYTAELQLLLEDFEAERDCIKIAA